MGDKTVLVVFQTFPDCHTLKSRALLFIFQLCLYLTIWLADFHFGPNVICRSPMTKICIFWGVKNAIQGIKNAKNCKKKCLAPNATWGSHDQNLHIFGVKNAHLERQKWQILAKVFFLLQCPQKKFGGLPWIHLAKFAYLGGQNAHFGGLKLQKKLFLFFAPHAPKSHLTVWPSPMTKICIFWGVKNTHFGVKNAKISKKMFWLRIIWGSLHDQNFHIRGSKYAHFGGHKCQNVQIFCVPNAPKSHLGFSHEQNLHILGGQKCRGWFFGGGGGGGGMPPSHLGVSSDQHLHIFGAKLSAPCCYQYSSL